MAITLTSPELKSFCYPAALYYCADDSERYILAYDDRYIFLSPPEGDATWEGIIKAGKYLLGVPEPQYPNWYQYSPAQLQNAAATQTYYGQGLGQLATSNAFTFIGGLLGTPVKWP